MSDTKFKVGRNLKKNLPKSNEQDSYYKENYSETNEKQNHFNLSQKLRKTRKYLCLFFRSFRIGHKCCYSVHFMN